ncbi:Sodium- and chloride-dependent betaine transporter [Liparis tanakae]|uniref:Sodium-and chloride-dependent betaine transporter n=1 Tax=Liparis tanakae TaxID=230148 RepID=A0A4Z2EBF6_9TELE|nr:Sodium- and chloride-dependent betaine transporter [Liparis tanakae]
MAQKQGVAVESVVESGPGLAFIAYPQATAMMPFPQFWTICFFLMLLLLSVDTHFVTVECFTTTISDLFPKLLRKPGRHELLVLLVCSSFFLIHLLLVTEVKTHVSVRVLSNIYCKLNVFLNNAFSYRFILLQGGIYIFLLIDYYALNRVCHYFLALSECLALAWIFGM